MLSDNKILLSASFAELPQTLKPDFEIVNEILNIPITQDGEQHKDNNNSITQYIESNNDKILHLAEKNYEDLVEVLINNAINAAASSSNPTISLSSSLTF